MSGTEIRAYLQRTITALRAESPVTDPAEEPPVTVVAEVDCCFDVGLRADLAEDHPETVKWLITQLTDRDGPAGCAVAITG